MKMFPSGTPSRRGRLALAVTAVAGLVAVGTAAAVNSRTTVAPSNGSAPTISGTTTAGSTLTANPGTWSGSAPISFQYQWRVCGGNGGNCHDIAGATAQTYQIKNDDAGNTLRVQVIASNSDGSSTATSDATANINAVSNAPANSSPPSISGSASSGSTLTANAGTWTGAAPITFQYQWRICDGNGNACHDIVGATGQTYVLKDADTGNTVRVQVVASNSSGSSNVTSNPSALIARSTPAPAPTGCPKLAAGAQSVSVADVASPARLQVTQFQANPAVITRSLSDFTVRFHVADTCGQAVQGAQVYATAVPFAQVTIPAQQQTDANGDVTLQFHKLAGFPAARNQRLLVIFVRASKAGDPVLAGISTRRLISLRVNLNG